MTVSPDIQNFVPPSLDTVKALTLLPKAWHHPAFFGLENIDPNLPCLFVGNHTLFGAIDTPLILAELYQSKHIFCRSLADHIHFSIPGWGDFLRSVGAVDGTRENCAALMQSGQHILVFPGGGREVVKRKGEKYQLIWKQRTGFARMAIEYGYPIIPFAAIGADDSYDIWWDANDLKESWLGKLALKIPKLRELARDGDMIPPIATGFGYSPMPKPIHFYFMFGKSIDTKRFAGNADNVEAQWQLRQETEQAINLMLNAQPKDIHQYSAIKLISHLFHELLS